MSPRQPFELIFDPEVRLHLKKIERRYHPLIQQNIEQFLSYEPDVETRNRKPLLRPSILETAWELRFGPDNQFRVFYKFNTEVRQVYILAIGLKIREKLFIGGKEIKL